MLACAIGKFDALHRGHRELIRTATSLGDPAVLRFTGMAEVLGWAPRQPLLADDERRRLLDAWGVRELTLPFADVRPLDAAAFLARLRDLGAGALVVGEDFRCGRDRAAGAAELPALAAAAGLAAAVVGAVSIEGAPVSSTRIRSALEQGDITLVARLLDRPYRFSATVVRGEGRGRQLGFPTANCGEARNQPPAPGVYAARAWLPGRGSWPAAVNAGHLPTVGDHRPFVVEAHLIGFTGECYGAPIALDLLTRLRGEQRFPSLEALRGQIASDVAATIRIATEGRAPA